MKKTNADCFLFKQSASPIVIDLLFNKFVPDAFEGFNVVFANFLA
jgi:hypothetical protein